MPSPSYILMTAAHNEARFLPDTIASVLAQTVRPRAWIIVSDRSTDETDAIAAAAAEAHDFIRFLRFENPLPRSPHPMGGTSWKKVSALRAGLAALGDIYIDEGGYDYIGNLDADVTFAPDYYATLMQRMQASPHLGIAGGFIYNVSEGRKWPYFANPEVVGGPSQFFRRETWQQIGGYVPWGQDDAIAQMMARMHGWGVRSFDDLRILHHKTAKEKSRNPLRGKFHAGKMERAMGYHPLYAAAKCFGRLGQKPMVLGSLAQLYGYTWAAWKNIRTDLPAEVVEFNRRQQLKNLRRRLFGARG
ncbi:glycosyltransferase family 2 protein [uncultured Amaricoccus sp.]|uniref:glycosyltransferase n=1 Tax=uncultured Amaricoccus sp. TaxID=339341 RepID=UPI00262A21F6|nr:glycosyltransferase family A protein [uncultured Amaricoccus sp.]